jgi:hypothetical protein
MALTLTLLGSVTFNTTSGTKTVTATPAVGDVPVIITAHSGFTTQVAPTDNNGDGGGTYTLAQSCLKNTSADRMDVWVRDVPIGVAASTVFTHAPGTTTGGGLAVIKVAGADKAGLTGLKVKAAAQQNAAASTTPTVSMGSAISTSNAVIGAVFSGTNSTTTVANNASYTEVFDNGYATPTSGLEVMTRNSGETGSSIAWGGTSSSAYGAVVIELDASQLADVSTLTDDFQDGSIGSQWTTGNLFSSTSLGASATISESGGKARFAVNSGTYNASKGYVSVAQYDWASTNGAYFQLPSIPDTSAYCAIMFTARVDTSKLGVYVATNGLNIGIGDTTFGDRTAVSYNSATMGWLRLRYDSANTRWEGAYAPPSEDPPATWTVFGTITDASVPGTTNAKTGKVALEVLAFGTIPSTAEYFAVESVSTGTGASTTGTLTATEAKDTAAVSASIVGTGTLGATEAGDTSGLTGTVAWVATLAATEAKDTASVTANIIGTGTLGPTEGSDTSGITANIVGTGTLGATDAADASGITGTVGSTVSGTLAATDAGDTSAITAAIVGTGTLGPTEAGDNSGITGAITGTGTLGATEAKDVAAVSANIVGTGTLAANDNGDSAGVTGGIVGTGTLSASEAGDGANIVAAIVVSGTLAATESKDVVAITGGPVISGTVAANENADGAAFTGRVGTFTSGGSSSRGFGTFMQAFIS